MSFSLVMCDDSPVVTVELASGVRLRRNAMTDSEVQYLDAMFRRSTYRREYTDGFRIENGSTVQPAVLSIKGEDYR